MESVLKVDGSFPTPPPCLSSEESRIWHDIWTPQIHSYSPPLPPYSFSSPLPVSADPSDSSRPRFVSYETNLFRSPALITCGFCHTQVTTQVTFKVGTYAWLMCLVFVFCGLLFGCCLIPFFINHFKDAHHTCPRCQQVLHVQKKGCCE
ncbi:unnamed protein product [Menidia menidia]|uniref:(Atlantic silverside) hypothetical protein n=1 Tax=Menidia menidia TaxID=238744 RepID=A0A8S4B3F8_9TELE|nr:unnamed protein product [Menidia menidia]